MEQKYTFTESKVIINGVEVFMGFPIKEIRSIDDWLFILLDIPRGIPLTEKENRNILCYNSSGDLCWEVSLRLPKGITSKETIPYIAIDVQGKELYGFDFWGRKFHIDKASGNLLDFKVYR